MEMQEVWVELKPHFKGMAKVLAEKVIKASIEELVVKSENKIDDAVVGMLMPLAMAELEKQIEHL